MKSQPDEIDHWCIAWARQRRIALGIIDAKMIEPKERIGRLRCTLGKIHIERDGASYARNSQHFPEVYLGMALLIHQAYSIMPAEQRLIMHLHYVWREVPVKEKLAEVPTNLTSYWSLVGSAKSFIRGYVASQQNFRALFEQSKA